MCDSEQFECLVDCAIEARSAFQNNCEEDIKLHLSEIQSLVTALQSRIGNDSFQEGESEQSQGADPERQLDTLFYNFLGFVCTNYELKDSLGVPVHINNTAKKLDKLLETFEFSIIKFRATSFTRAFYEYVLQDGTCFNQKEIKIYLYEQRYLSRYNKANVRIKSKGIELYAVQGRKTGGGWIFEAFEPRFTQLPPTGIVSQEFHWNLNIHDPHGCFDPVFTTRDLPFGFRLDWNQIIGVPSDPGNFEIKVCCVYSTMRHHKKKVTLSFSQLFTIQTVP